MSYHNNREAKVMIAGALVDKGWKIFGYKCDESDSMTDYWSPASWNGIATKNGFVLVIDQHSTYYSGYEVKKYNYNKTTYKASERIAKLTAMMNDVASTENEKVSCKELIKREQEKQGIAPTYSIIETYPTFTYGNPKHNNWHIEKDGQIIAKGSGAFAVNSYDWENEEKTATEQKAEKLAKFIAKIEKILTDSDVLKAEVIKVPVTVVKEVELDINTLTETDIKEGFTFIMKVGYTNGNYKGTKYQFSYKYDGKNSSWFNFAKLGKKNKQSKAMGNTWRIDLNKLNQMLAKGHIAVIEFKEVTEYIEKTVFKKTKRTHKASDAVQIESNEPVVEQTEEVTEAVKTETVNAKNTTEDQATKRQLWAIHCATKLNTTNLVISKQKASELISKSKAGNSIFNEVKALLADETTPQEKSEKEAAQETLYKFEQLEEMVDAIIEYTADLMFSYDYPNTLRKPEATEEKKEFANNLQSYMIERNYPINAITDHVQTNYATYDVLIEALESLSSLSKAYNSKQQKMLDQSQHVEKIDSQINSAQKKLDALHGNHLTNTWKRQQVEVGREMKRESLRYDIALLEYLKYKTSNNSMTNFEQHLLNGAFRDQIHNYSLRDKFEYPQIFTEYDNDHWYNKEVPKKQKRLNKAGIYNTAQLAEVVEEYKAIRDEVKKPASPIKQKIKKLESEVKFSKIAGYFPTPKKVVERMLDIANIGDGETILEPSAGNGNILDCITAHIQENGITVSVDAVEWNYSLREILELKNYKLVSNDFMEYGKYNHYDKIIMNPPFERNQDIQHVQHAYKCLNSNGRIVAIMSPHFTFASDATSVNFREWLNGRGYYEKLPEGSFKESGTNVNTVLIVIDKIEETAAEAM
ncbi:methyltransferase [Paenibacillus sp. GCM10027627]|uniref:methyltransferase n=1 Tax=unclassified Paenibacillus TaxID=185978 RepID=UPI00363D7D1F